MSSVKRSLLCGDLLGRRSRAAVLLLWLGTCPAARADQPRGSPAFLPIGPAPPEAAPQQAETRRIDPTSWPASHAAARPSPRGAWARGDLGRPSLLAPLAAASLSLASAVAGAALLLDTRLRFPEAEARCQAGCSLGDITPLEQRAYAGYGLLAIGAAGATVSLLDLVLTLRPLPSPWMGRAVTRVVLVPTTAGLLVAGRF